MSSERVPLSTSSTSSTSSTNPTSHIPSSSSSMSTSDQQMRVQQLAPENSKTTSSMGTSVSGGKNPAPLEAATAKEGDHQNTLVQEGPALSSTHSSAPPLDSSQIAAASGNTLLAATPAALLPPPDPSKKKTEEKSKQAVAIQNALKRLADAKTGKRDLKMLLLCDVKLSEADISALAPSVKTSTCLRSLSLYGSGLSGAAAKLLADALASHEALTLLDLGNNELGTKGVEDVSNNLMPPVCEALSY